MSNPGDTDQTPVSSMRQLADFIAVGCKPKDQWRIGTEHEKFGFRLGDLAAPEYETPGGIRDTLEGLLGYGGPTSLATPIGTGASAFVPIRRAAIHLNRNLRVAKAGVYYLNDKIDTLLAAIESRRTAIESGLDRQSLQRLLPPGGARNAIDCAMWELEASRSGIAVGE